MTWEQIESVLPKEGHAGRVRFLDLCDGFHRQVIKDPYLPFKPEETFPDISPRDKKNWCSDEQWKKILWIFWSTPHLTPRGTTTRGINTTATSRWAVNATYNRGPVHYDGHKYPTS